MPSAILYRVLTGGTPVPVDGGGVVYVRAERNPNDVVHALDEASPRENEIVLNSVAID